MVGKIADVMTKQVITIKKDSTVMDVVKLMVKHTISCVIVTDSSNVPVGIVTERDMVRRVLGNSLDPSTTNVGDVMSSPVITISSEKKITDAINMMQKYRFRRVVMTDNENRLIGILTQSDLLLEVYKVQKELEKMNENLRNSIKSLKRYSEVGTGDARVKSLKAKISRLEKTLERLKKEEKA